VKRFIKKTLLITICILYFIWVLYYCI